MHIQARACHLALLVVVLPSACGSVNNGGSDSADAAASDDDGGDSADAAADADADAVDAGDAAVEAQCSEGLAFVPGGTFTLADKPGEVVIEPFCMDITHVTAGAYAGCVSCSPADTAAMCNTDIASRELDPANCVDLAQAEFYCESLDRSVPTEEQWEWAARGGESANLYAWGDDPPVEDDDRLCWFAGRVDQTFPDRPSATCPVGFYDQQAVHPFGLEDMTGNVWTWTTSEGSEEANRVVRGGGWDNTLPGRMTTGFRNDLIQATIRHPALGFRCVQAPL